MKAVLISIKPRWCELIASGSKTVEVRKTRPKLETPFKVYIYETKALYKPNGCRCFYEGKGKVIGEFVCDKIYDIKPHYDIPTFCNQYEYGWKIGEAEDCLSFEELDFYLGGKNGYGWHISSLVIYDKPRELSEFKQVRKIRGYHKKDEPKTERIYIQALLHSSRVEVKYLTRPPQSWCYVESEGAK